ncbi:QWRF motif-containing protein 7 [Andrographis paniculata]|uniref:QWRF motif-containing protein 7 n=1 Tax=Andrographis paniculata TaxID=175694 RepID=UPI0021E8597F|nr:QWRF motif-containing protein 7 [Andrographis paniculata]
MKLSILIEDMESSPCRRQQQGGGNGGGDSTRLLHRKSGRAAAAPVVNYRTEKIQVKSAKKQESVDEAGGFVRLLPRSRSHTEIPRRTRSGTTSPSAWALSPGRQSPWSSPAPTPKSAIRSENSTKQEAKSSSGGGRGVGGVLKYFRQKKVSPALEEEYHRYRVAYNRLLQWRFANARAEASMAAVRKLAQKRLWNAWAKLSVMRNSMVEKRLRIRNNKHELKLYEITKSELRLLEEWSRIEKKNTEAVGRVVRKLSAISVCLPLVQNAEGDTTAVDGAISTATEVMGSITEMVQNMNWQVEKECFLITELSIVLNQQKQMFQQLQKCVTLVASMAVEEKILRAQQIQLLNEVNTIQTTVDY